MNQLFHKYHVSSIIKSLVFSNMRLLLTLVVLSLVHFTACSSNQKTKALQIGAWKSLNSGTDIDIIDSSRFNMLLRNDDGTVDSIRWWYKTDGRKFDIYTHAFLASENEILKLTNDSFIYVRPNDLDTFRYVRMK